jgi:hypothetical protein
VIDIPLDFQRDVVAGRTPLLAAFTHIPNLVATNLSRAITVEVIDKQSFSDGRREVTAYAVDNPNATERVIG